MLNSLNLIIQNGGFDVFKIVVGRWTGRVPNIQWLGEGHDEWLLHYQSLLLSHQRTYY